MATPESKVKTAVKARLKALGAWYTMPMGTGYGNSGVPDFLVCHLGRFIAIETKAPGRRANTTPMQKNQLAAITASGGRAVVIDDASQLDEVFNFT